MGRVISFRTSKIYSRSHRGHFSLVKVNNGPFGATRGPEECVLSAYIFIQYGLQTIGDQVSDFSYLFSRKCPTNDRGLLTISPKLPLFRGKSPPTLILQRAPATSPPPNSMFRQKDFGNMFVTYRQQHTHANA